MAQIENPDGTYRYYCDRCGGLLAGYWDMSPISPFWHYHRDCYIAMFNERLAKHLARKKNN